ncbi:MAG: hypothetical protein ACRDBO_16215 [Lachnospiraceae bacterium]
MGINSKGKRKIIIDGVIYWWFVREDKWGEPIAHIIADDHSFVATCNLYCPLLTIVKDKQNGARNIPMLGEIKGECFVFTPQYIEQLIRAAMQ